jgi:hypothetical protein
MYLDIFNNFSIYGNFPWVFSQEPVNRDKLSNLLGISRKTVYRWEREILAKVHPLKTDYFLYCPRIINLSNYQRFILCLIFCLKYRKNYENKDVITYLRKNFGKLRRGQFDNWIKSIHIKYKDVSDV